MVCFMEMKPKALSLRLLLLFLAFSFVLSRTLKTNTDKQWIQESEENQGKVWGFLDESEFHVEGRMDIESTDYDGTGANKNHDPKPPGSEHQDLLQGFCKIGGLKELCKLDGGSYCGRWHFILDGDDFLPKFKKAASFFSCKKDSSYHYIRSQLVEIKMKRASVQEQSLRSEGKGKFEKLVCKEKRDFVRKIL